MRPAGLCVFGVNGECMVRGVIGGRSESRPRVPGVRYKVELVGLFKLTNGSRLAVGGSVGSKPVWRGAGALLTVGSVAANGEFR